MSSVSSAKVRYEASWLLMMYSRVSWLFTGTVERTSNFVICFRPCLVIYSSNMVAPTSQLPPSTKTTPAKWDSRFAGHVPHDGSYYSKCMLGGILACGLTHTAICPLDVTKCNMQVSGKKRMSPERRSPSALLRSIRKNIKV